MVENFPIIRLLIRIFCKFYSKDRGRISGCLSMFKRNMLYLILSLSMSSTVSAQVCCESGVGLARSIATPSYSDSTYHSYYSFLLNGIVPAAELRLQQGGFASTDALTAGINVPSTVSTHQANAMGLYLVSNRGTYTAGGGDVGLYIGVHAAADNSNVFGINPVLVDTGHNTGQKLQNEYDFNVASTSTSVAGLSLVLLSSISPAGTVGFTCRITGLTAWGTCFYTADGGATDGVVLGTASAGGNSNSQTIQLRSRSASGTINIPMIFADANGSLVLRPGLAGAAIGFQDYGGANDGYIDSGGLNVTGAGTFGGSINAKTYAGKGTAGFATITAGAGAGATVSCASGHVCDSFSGTLKFVGGSGASAGANFLTVSFPTARTSLPNCIVSLNNGASSLSVYALTENTSSFTLNTAEALDNGAIYVVNYICAGQ